jgi:hypothetical protein
MADPKNGTVTVTGGAYNLQVTIGSPPETIVSFVFTLFGDDGKQYHLQDVGTKKQVKLVRKLFAALGEAWPDDSITVEADAQTRVVVDVPDQEAS